MTLKEFRRMNMDGQAAAAWNGTFMETRSDARYHIHLFNVADFYVKVYYSGKLNEIVKISAFKSTAHIEGHLNVMGKEILDGLF